MIFISGKATAQISIVAEAPSAAPNSGKVEISPELRYRMVAEAAYYRAEKHGFTADKTMKDWLDAESDIDRMLNSQK